MSQSSFIAAALLAGLVLFIAARGRLKAYADVLFGPAPPLGAFEGIPLLTGGPAAKGGGGGGGPGLAAPAAGLGSFQGANDNSAGNANWLNEGEAILGDAAKAAEVIGMFG